MMGLPFAFTFPLALGALIALPLIWWLLRLTPPSPRTEVFPPLRILAGVLKREETPAKSPWWLTLLRMIMAAAVILAIAGPVYNPQVSKVAGNGPLALVIDNSWASAADWDKRVETAKSIIEDGADGEKPVAIVFTADQTHDATPGTARAALEKLAAAKPHPLKADRAKAIEALRAELQGQTPGTLAFISDGIDEASDRKAMQMLAELKPQSLDLIEGDNSRAVALTSASNDASSMTVTATRLDTAAPARHLLVAQDSQGRPIATGDLDFAAGAATASAKIDAPFEMRNDFARIAIRDMDTAGAAYLLDDGFKRRRVALISGEAANEFQPLLSPLYYIRRALEPYADLIVPDNADMSVAIPNLLEQKPSVIIMADVGRLPAETYAPLERWLANGGMLIRFAGPRLAAAPADDPLVPVTLRQGERALGGALSWAEPQPLADFPPDGPFAGLPTPKDILVKRQVLAEPSPDLAARTWASLADGTPLVTAKPAGAGNIVLFHVSAEATWSNLPISGEFVEMLRRVVQLSRSGGATAETTANSIASLLPPYRLLTATGALTSDTGSAKPLDIAAKGGLRTSFDNPPGLYGSEDGFTALNLMTKDDVLKPLDLSGITVPVTRSQLVGNEALSLKPPLFILAFILLALDSLIVLFINGAFARLPKATRAAGSAAAVLLLAAAFAFAVPPQARADDSKPGDDILMKSLDTTHLAYVVTGEKQTDDISEAGLKGLTEFLTYRTALEPGEPIGVDISQDELAFYPMIYWPVSATAPMPSPAAISRIDAYMRNGGTVLFDTRDHISALGDDSVSANGERLQMILANLDIPPLEPVPADHVLTKAFYLLSSFPGRYAGGPLWVEARQDPDKPNRKTSSSGDGVSPILITGNDFAGAWAVNDRGEPLLPTVPNDETQREYAYRVGVNIMMYMLTGNYKADQVHIPALLERLGQ